MLRSVNVFVDIGASLGKCTLHAKKLIRSGHILAIAADPKCHNKLVDNCREWESPLVQPKIVLPCRILLTLSVEAEGRMPNLPTDY